MKLRFVPFLLFLLSITLSQVVNADDTKKKRVVFLAGKPSHGYGSHEHLAGSRILAEAINQSHPQVQCEVIPGGWPTDESVLEGADTIVMYCDGGKRHPSLAHLDTLQKHMDNGVGFVCLHYGVEVPKEAAGEQFLDWLGGYFETFWSVNPHWEASFESLPEHPVTSGVKPFKANDEWYFHMRFQPEMKGVTPILSAIAPDSTMTRKDGAHSGNQFVRKAVANRVPQHTAWIYERENGGRSFGFTGGHYHWNWGREDVLKLVCNAICWTAHADIPADGLAVIRPTLEQLEAGQDEEVSKRHNSEEVLKKFELTTASQ